NALGGVELELRTLIPHRTDIRVREGVVPDLVSFVPDPLHEARIALRILADEEERRLDVLRLQLVEHLRGVRRGRAVVDRQRNGLLLVAAARDDVGRRELVVVLVDGETAAWIDLQLARSPLRFRIDMSDLAIAN